MPGSTIDRWLTEGREEGAEKERLLITLTVALNLLKEMPQLFDVKIAEIASAKEKLVTDLRKIMKDNVEEKANKAILTKFFKKINLTEKDKAEISKAVKKYYASEKM